MSQTHHSACVNYDDHEATPWKSATEIDARRFHRARGFCTVMILEEETIWANAANPGAIGRPTVVHTLAVFS